MSRVIINCAFAIALSVFGLASCVDEPEPGRGDRDQVGLGVTSSASEAGDGVGIKVPST